MRRRDLRVLSCNMAGSHSFTVTGPRVKPGRREFNERFATVHSRSCGSCTDADERSVVTLEQQESGQHPACHPLQLEPGGVTFM